MALRLSGGDEALRAKAAAIAMGRAPFLGDTVVLDRITVLGRLSAHGIPKAKVRLTGARAVAVTKDQQTFGADALLKAAEEYLTSHRPGPPSCGWKLVRRLCRRQ